MGNRNVNTSKFIGPIKVASTIPIIDPNIKAMIDALSLAELADFQQKAEISLEYCRQLLIAAGKISAPPLNVKLAMN